MRPLLFLFFQLTFLNCFSQNTLVKNDTIQREENVMLYLDNGFSVTPFAVSGEIYLTNELFIFHPKRYRKKRFDMYHDLMKDVILPYDSIVLAKRKGVFNLKLMTMSKKYKISYSNNWGKGLKSTITEIRSRMKEHTLR
ncbi:MAG: hypothetical protein ACKO96_47055 [Flammeovirgaceae bacterium]